MAEPDPSASRLAPGELGPRVQADKGLQESLLQGVAPLLGGCLRDLPDSLRIPLVNAVLLRRLIDCVDRDGRLPRAHRHRLKRQLLAVLRGEHRAEAVRDRLYEALADRLHPAERELVRRCDGVLRVTRLGLPVSQRRRVVADLRRYCAQGLRLQRMRHDAGYWPRYQSYCEHTGSSLALLAAELTASGAPPLQRQAMLEAAEALGRGWAAALLLSQAAGSGVLAALPPTPADWRPAGGRGRLQPLIAQAYVDLRTGFRGVLLLPQETAALRPCIAWMTALALIALHRLRAQDGLRGAEFSLSRPVIAGTWRWCRLAVRHEWLLKFSFWLASLGLPRVAPRTTNLAFTEAARRATADR